MARKTKQELREELAAARLDLKDLKAVAKLRNTTVKEAVREANAQNKAVEKQQRIIDGLKEKISNM